MITLKTLTWDNCFSYGNSNSLELDKSPLTQLIGNNGSGKTSIPLIIQEVLYGKNSKNIKKQDIANRYTSDKNYSISISFSKDQDEYVVILKRKSTLKLTLLKNGEDISSHTSPNTYKTIADILGIADFKTFTQLIYQSSTSSLDFLTATDTNRKKFLISLLQLEKYTALHENFKVVLKEKTGLLQELKGKRETIKSWIATNEKVDLTEKAEVEIPEGKELIYSIKGEIAKLKDQLENIKNINSKITTNNSYYNLLKEFDPQSLIEEHDETIDKDLTRINKEISTAQNTIETNLSIVKKLKNLQDKCPTCLQDVSTDFTINYINELESIVAKAEEDLNNNKVLKRRIQKINNNNEEVRKKRQDFEKLQLLYNPELEKTTLDKNDIEAELQNLESKSSQIEKEIQEAIKTNQKIAAHNSKVKVIREQLGDYRNKISAIASEQKEIEDQVATLEVLRKAFSTNGLVGYKIESSVKELEQAINEYLAEFSHFQLFFKLDNDKLNIQVVDSNGNETTIEGLSAGELGRVNIATILAIRKVMTSLTSTKINFLFLDEIVGVLDAEGRDKLIDILLQEDLNTFIVDHGQNSHPLVAKLYINKNNNISRIEI
jgi:DNA repair exonuclease SbcCD ATPase subunit